jgi:hypothetical protein
MLEGDYPGERSPFDLFRFADLVRDGRAPLDAGALPWWSAPDLRIAMFRPLSSALIALDWRLFGADPFAAHLHSLAWLAACVVALATALGGLLPRSIVAVALLAFVVNEAHVLPVAWLANRSYLIAGTFGWLGVWAHGRAQQRHATRHRVAEPLFFALALAAGEYALAMLAYPIALEATAAGRSVRTRALALLPALGPGIVYLAIRGGLGFGTRGSGFYLDPAATPLAYATAAFDRLPTLTAMLVLGDTAALGLDPTNPRAWLGAGVAAGAMLIAAAWWAGRDLPLPQRRALLGVALGALLSLAPTGGALPDTRLLGAAAGGMAAVVAAVLVTAATRLRRATRERRALPAVAFGAAVALLVLVHGLGAAARSRRGLEDFASRARAEWRWAQDAGIPADPGARVIFLSGSDFTTNASLPWVRQLGGKVSPRSYWRLSPYPVPHQLRRVADDTLEVQVGRAAALPLADSLHRSASELLSAGDVIELDGMQVTVLDAQWGEPSRLRFRFERSLDDPSYVFLHGTPRGFERVALPPLGGKLRLPPPAVPPR